MSTIGKYARRKAARTKDHLIESETERGVFTNCGRYMPWKDKGGRPLIVSDTTEWPWTCQACA